MNILQVSSFFKPSWEAGGTVRVCYEISKKLVERGHKVTVYTTDGFKYRLKVRKNRPIYVDGITVYYFRNISSFLAAKNICLPYFLPHIAKKELNKFDIIHMHTFRGPMAIPVFYYAKRYNVPYIIQPHGSLKIITKKELKKLYDKFFGYNILKNAFKLIALTETEAEQYIKMGMERDKVEIVPNGINPSEYENLPEKGTFRRKYGIKDSEKIILYVGRLHKSKGIDLLLNAFSIISRETENIKLVLVGPDDGYKMELLNLSQRLNLMGRIIFTGFVSHVEKLAAYVDADVFVTPKFSGFPVTFLEAMAVGIPIITTNRGDKLGWLDKKVGYVTNYNAGDMAETIYKVIDNNSLRKNFYENAQKLIREEFNWEKITQKIETIYYECF